MKRRMIAPDIISEGRFLRMSLTAQALYMHLVANADDDGCVDAYTITRMIGAKEDDLVLLKEREYITVLDEKEYILWITGWQDFNWIDARYKEDSKYLPLLRAKVQGLEIVESTTKAYNKRRYQRRKLEKELSAHVQHMGNTGAALVSTPRVHGIGEERIGKESNSPLPPSEGEEKAVALSPLVREVWEYWEEQLAPITRNKIFNRNSLSQLLKAHGVEKVQKMIRVAAMAHVEQYAPKNLKVTSPKELEIQWDALALFAKAKFTQAQVNAPIR